MMSENKEFPKMPEIVTITSDFGWKDYYLAVIKGAILSKSSSINIVDITHQIENYDIVQAAFIVKNSWPSFPERTIHLVSVNDFDGAGRGFLAIRHANHYFIGPDNGLFSLIFSELPAEVYRLNADLSGDFPLKNIYADCIGHIVNGHPFEAIGTKLNAIDQRISLQPVITPSRIQGAVIHIDNYENVIVNISRELFDKVGHSRSFSLSFKRHDPIERLSHSYREVPVGETLCFFNSSGYLEIAINMGKASSLLDLKLEDSVQIDFHQND